MFMEIPITQFRRDIFTLVNEALDGREVWVSHKGRRLKLVPEGRPANRLSGITPMEIVTGSGGASGLSAGDKAMKAEMTRSWERDWDRDFGRAPGSRHATGKTGSKS